MRPLKVNFMPQRPRWLLLGGWIVVCMLATAYLLHMGWRLNLQAKDLDRQNLELSLEINELEPLPYLAPQAAGDGSSPVYYSDAKAVAKVGEFPLQQVLKALESTQLPGLRVSAIDIRPDQGIADVTLDFADYKSLLSYLDILNEGEPKPRWVLLRAEGGNGADRRTATLRSVW